MPGSTNFRRGRRFATKHEGQNRRRHIWICQQCKGWYREQKPRQCHCGSESFWYMPSTKEATRAAHLLMLEKYGQIRDLQFSVPFDHVVNGIKCFTYRADAVYVDKQSGKTVVEDTKGKSDPKTWDPVFKLKKQCIEAAYGIEITIVAGKQ